MSVTMLPSGGTVNPFNPFRPNGGYSEEDYQTPEQIENAAELAKTPSISADNWLQTLIDRANNGDEAALEKLINYWSTEESAKTAREWSAAREDTAYQRLMDDFKKAGLTPYVLSGGTPFAQTYSGKSYSGSEMTSQKNNVRSQSAENRRDIATRLLQIVGVVAGALIYALA